MIDTNKIAAYYKEKKIYSIEAGIGEDCQRGCVYCYLNSLPHENKKMDGDIIRMIIEDAGKLEVVQIDWKGEPLLNKNFFNYIEQANKLNISSRLWTGGLALQDPNVQKNIINSRGCELLAIELSTVNAKMYGKLHPERPLKDLEIILRAIKKLLDAGFPPERMLISSTFTGLQTAEDMIHTIDFMEKKFNIKTWPAIYNKKILPDALNKEDEMYFADSVDAKKVYERFQKQWQGSPLTDHQLIEKFCSTSISVMSNGRVLTCCGKMKNKLFVKPDVRLFDIVQEHKEELLHEHKIPGDMNCLTSECSIVSTCREGRAMAGNA